MFACSPLTAADKLPTRSHHVVKDTPPTLERKEEKPVEKKKKKKEKKKVGISLILRFVEVFELRPAN